MCHQQFIWCFSKWANSLTAYSFINGFLAPLAFIVLFYFLVLCRLHSLKPIKDGKISENKRQLHQKVTKLVLTVVSVYIVCWLPHWTVQMVLIFQPPDSQQHTGLMVTVLLTTCLAYAPKSNYQSSYLEVKYSIYISICIYMCQRSTI